mgnify:FL=1
MSREISDNIRNDLKYTYYIMKTRMQTNTQHPHSGILSSSEQLLSMGKNHNQSITQNGKRNDEIKEDNFVCELCFQNFHLWEGKKHTIPELKQTLRSLGLKISGKKSDLIQRIETHLTNLHYSTVIQKNVRAYLTRSWFSEKKRANSKINYIEYTNCNDFLTFTELNDLSIYELYSWRDSKGFLYGMSINSMEELCKRPLPRNPYNRETFASSHIDHFRRLQRITKALFPGFWNSLEANTKTTTKNRNTEEEIKRLTVDVFQQMDLLGNYTNIYWFSGLSRRRLIRFVLDLFDIWSYRSQIPDTQKREICNPSGDPFTVFQLQNTNTHNLKDKCASSNDLQLRRYILLLITDFITRGISESHCALGCTYVLTAFTLVSPEAAEALPWLYESVVLQPYM